MNYQIKRFASLSILLTILFSATLTMARSENDGNNEFDDNNLFLSNDNLLPRKTPSIFKRPSRKNPSDQLIYARQLETEGKIRKAGRQYNALVHRWHDTKEAVIAQESYARTLTLRRKYSKAFEEYQYLIENYTGMFDYLKIIALQYRIANEISTKGNGKNAIPLYEYLVEHAPQWENAPLCQMMIGRIYQKNKDYDEASLAFEYFLTRYAEHSKAADAACNYAICLTEISRQHSRDEKSCRRALSALASYLHTYHEHPEYANIKELFDERHKHLVTMNYDRAYFYDKRKNYKAAIIAYTDFVKRFPAAEQTHSVQKRINELKMKTKE